MTARPRYTWQYLIAALLGFALLTGTGIFALQSVGDTGKLASLTKPKSGNAQQAPAAKLDPEATIAILNGTDVQGLAASLDNIVTTEDWGQILFSGSAATTDVKISAVFYRDPAHAGAAAGLAAKLGGISTYATQEYAEYDSQLIVLIGADYQGPGLKEAKEAAKKAAEPEESPAPDEEAQPVEVNPVTGNTIDPATGWDIDPVTGFPIDPATGIPTDPATIEPPAAPQ